MARVAILGDLHLGARNSSNHFSDYFNRFFTEVFYPYCKEHKIKNVIQLGDCFDNRTNLSYKAFHRCKDTWFGSLQKHGMHMYILLGNHDIAYRHTLEINSPELLLGEYHKNVTIISKPTVLELYGKDFDIVPWVCDENSEAVRMFMSREDRSPIVMGHFEIAGFPMAKGQPSHSGSKDAVFDNYATVFSGHFHTRSEKGNVVYTGIPYEITWSDYADPKGFYVYDTVKNSYEFVRNNLCMFEKVVYNNGQNVNISSLKDKIVKIVVAEKKDPVLYERWVDSIRLVQPYELSIIENADYQMSGELDDSIEIEDTQKIIDTYIDGIETTVSKDDLKKYISTLYAEALTLDDSI